MPHLYNPAVTKPLKHDFNNNIQDSIILDLLPDISKLELLVYEIKQQ